MEIVLHGAINFGSSNFGDFIYANGIYNTIISKTWISTAVFYNPSSYFIKYIENYSAKKISLKETMGLIYIPGGYFIQEKNPSLKSSLFRFFRYIPIGLKCNIMKIPICIIGIGAGPINSKILKYGIKKICEKASCITVRDKKSLNTLQNMCKCNLYNYGDMILSFELKSKRKVTEQIKLVQQWADQKKIVIIHYNHSIVALKLFSKIVKRIKEKGFKCIVSSDSILANENELFKIFTKNTDNDIYHFKYDDPFEFLELINMADLIITCKLHAGVVASLFGKSVVCTAINSEKTRRYYEQIERLDCYRNIENVTLDSLYSLVENALNKPITIPIKIIEESKKHQNILCKFINGLQNEE